MSCKSRKFSCCNTLIQLAMSIQDLYKSFNLSIEMGRLKFLLRFLHIQILLCVDINPMNHKSHRLPFRKPCCYFFSIMQDIWTCYSFFYEIDLIVKRPACMMIVLAGKSLLFKNSTLADAMNHPKQDRVLVSFLLYYPLSMFLLFLQNKKQKGIILLHS